MDALDRIDACDCMERVVSYWMSLISIISLITYF